MEILHFSHQHPLVMNYKDDPVQCYSCNQSFTGPSFSCVVCDFFLHKSCAEQPTEIQHFSHQHPLVMDYKDDPVQCCACNRFFIGPSFSCVDCGFFLHKSCAKQPTTIQHFSHQHLLVMDYKDDPVQCYACNRFFTGPSFSCVVCDFFLHKSCAEQPREIEHPLYPEHQLTLVLSSLGSDDESSIICKACEKRLEGFAYRCSACYFQLHLSCAVTDSFHTINAKQGKLLSNIKIQHFSHVHRLVQDYKDDPVQCYACNRTFIGPSFSCFACEFFLHKSCAELPREIQHPLHRHPLIQWMPSNDISIICHVCEKRSKGFMYFCDVCCFGIHVSCAIADLPNSFSLLQRTHFSHKHPLVLDFKDNPVRCYGCRRSIVGPCYSCSKNCHNFFLHIPCADLPREIEKHPLHLRHKLTLFPSTLPYFDGSCVCKACNKSSKGFTYHCFHCRFDLHTVCATLPSTIEGHGLGQGQGNGHKHTITLLLKSASFLCESCGNEGQGISYLCYTCQFWVDPNCALLSKANADVIANKTKIHPHPLAPTPISAIVGYAYDQDLFCDICEREIVNSDISVFFCEECELFVHIGCAVLLTQASSNDTSMTGDEGQEPDPIYQPSYNEFVATITAGVEDVELWDNETVLKLQHFSHQHPLTLADELKPDRKCAMCTRKISSPFFGCTECNFFLHSFCAKLPKTKRRHPLHLDDHTLTLHPAGDFSCNNCDESGHEFFYSCEDCNFKLDLRCGSIAKILIHDHEHPLHFVNDASSKVCNACCNSFKSGAYICVVCDFHLETRCALLPRTTRHKYDKHLLTLSCRPDYDEVDQYICDSCEDEFRDPKLWSYQCSQCAPYPFACHPKCVVGKY